MSRVTDSTTAPHPFTCRTSNSAGCGDRSGNTSPFAQNWPSLGASPKSPPYAQYSTCAGRGARESGRWCEGRWDGGGKEMGQEMTVWGVKTGRVRFGAPEGWVGRGVARPPPPTHTHRRALPCRCGPRPRILSQPSMHPRLTLPHHSLDSPQNRGRKRYKLPKPCRSQCKTPVP